MADFPYIKEHSGEKFYVKESENYTEEVPLVDIFLEYEINEKLPAEIASMDGQLECIDEEDVHAAAHYWGSEGDYQELKREAEAVISFNEQFETQGSESFLEPEEGKYNSEEDWIEIVNRKYFDIIERSERDDYLINFKSHDDEVEMVELEIDNAKVIAGTDSQDYLDLSYFVEGEREAMIRINRNQEGLNEEIEKRVEEMYTSAFLGSQSF